MKRYIILKTKQPVPKYFLGGLFQGNFSNVATGMLTGGLSTLLNSRRKRNESAGEQDCGCCNCSDKAAQELQQGTAQSLEPTEKEAIQETVETSLPNPVTQQKVEKVPKAQAGGSSDPVMSSLNMGFNQQPGLSQYQLGMLNGGGQQFNGPPILGRPQSYVPQLQPIQGNVDRIMGMNPSATLQPKTLAPMNVGGSGGGGGGLNLNSAKANGIAGAASAALNVATNIAGNVLENKKNTHTDGFGLETIDPKYEKAASRLGGFSKGAGMGASLGAAAGSVIPGLGTAVGGALGAIGGGLVGLFTSRARKKAQKKIDEYNRKYEKAHAGAVRNQDLAAAQALASMQQPAGQMMFKNGGKLTEKPGAVNIITKGKLHKENNNLGNKDKGVPVISSNGKKEYEVEKEELILRRDATLTLEDFVKKYDETKDDSVLEEIGKFMSAELLKNTQDNSDKYKVKVKNES